MYLAEGIAAPAVERQPAYDITAMEADQISEVRRFLQPAYARSYAEVAGLHPSLFINPTFAGRLEDQLEYLAGEAYSNLYVARSRTGEIAGTTGLDIKPDHRSGNIRSCYVGRLFQRQGVGQQLLTHSLQAAYQGGLRHVDLEVAEQAEAAMALYRRNGFEPQQRRRHSLPAWMEINQTNTYWQLRRELGSKSHLWVVRSSPQPPDMAA